MDQPCARDPLAVLLKRRARIKRLSARCDEQIANELERHPQLNGRTGFRGVLTEEVDRIARQGRPVLEMSTLAVVWRGKRCGLGPGIAWSLMAYLLGKSNCWIPYDDLRDDVWRDPLASGETIRAGVARLRERLCAAQMPQIATAICLKRQRCGYFADGPPR